MRHRHPGADLAEKVVDIGNCSGSEVDKFKRFRLTPAPALHAGPLVAQCLANIECRVADTALIDKYNLFLLEAVQVWTNPVKEGAACTRPADGTFAVDGRILNLQERMVLWKQFQD